MRNKKPMIIENPGSNSITRPLSKHTDELQSQANIHKNVDPYKYSNTTVSNEIPPIPQPTQYYYECHPTSSSLQSGYPILSQSASQQHYPMQPQYQ